ncbi:MAG TPA: DUF1799 domain-containing protein [Pseudorhodoferax sp.]|nr:DUF1799 domain-containing protein [Pseudorhodoferax sp.]
MYEPPVTEAEARSEGFELEDYTTDIVEVWPDNELALSVFKRVGTKWMIQAMSAVPYGLRWEAMYPLMDREGLDDAGWNDLHDALTEMEHAAIATMAEFAPKPEK